MTQPDAELFKEAAEALKETHRHLAYRLRLRAQVIDAEEKLELPDWESGDQIEAYCKATMHDPKVWLETPESRSSRPERDAWYRTWTRLRIRIHPHVWKIVAAWSKFDKVSVRTIIRNALELALKVKGAELKARHEKLNPISLIVHIPEYPNALPQIKINRRSPKTPQERVAQDFQTDAQGIRSLEPGSCPDRCVFHLDGSCAGDEGHPGEHLCSVCILKPEFRGDNP